MVFLKYEYFGKYYSFHTAEKYSVQNVTHLVANI